VRENNEGEYSEIGGRLYAGTEFEMAMQQSVFTRRGCDRVMRYAFELARTRKRHVTSATKSNGIIHTMPFWDERFAAMARAYADIETDQYHVDILTAHFVRHPDWFDVVVASNLFGDILSDLGPAIVGSIGIAPSGNINPEREYPSMFEPVHGSAPDIAGRGVANPIGQIWSGAMMLEHFGENDAARAIEGAIAAVLEEGGTRTPDLGGNAGTNDLGAAQLARKRRRGASGTRLRNTAVPSPHSPLTIGPTKSPGRWKPPAAGSPLSGATTNHATAVGKIAPNTMAPTQ
jgi:tartrate dehydrogenase/decarboxylase/D-malate dehydrogenase